MVEYVVTADESSTVVEGITIMAISATNAAEAEAMASAEYLGESNLRWTAPTPVSLATPPNDWVSYVARCKVSKTGETTIDVSVTGASTNTFAQFMALMVTALNATAIDNAAFTSDTLTVATGSGGDDLGDWKVEFWLTHPNGAPLEDLYVATITDEGVSTAALSVAFVANGTLSRSVAPEVVGVYK